MGSDYPYYTTTQFSLHPEVLDVVARSGDISVVVPRGTKQTTITLPARCSPPRKPNRHERRRAQALK